MHMERMGDEEDGGCRWHWRLSKGYKGHPTSQACSIKNQNQTRGIVWGKKKKRLCESRGGKSLGTPSARPLLTCCCAWQPLCPASQGRLHLPAAPGRSVLCPGCYQDPCPQLCCPEALPDSQPCPI